MGIELIVGNTGGPCSGKSSCRAVYEEFLIKAGYVPIFLDEAATRIILSNIKPDGKLFSNEEFQMMLAKVQYQMEQIYIESLNKKDIPFVLICDRTLIDAKAYMSNTAWNMLLAVMDLVESDLMTRYDLIIHLVTAADGAEAFYTCANNEARSETPEQARELDQKTKQAYYGYRNVYYIDNSTRFEEKLLRAVGIILSALGKAKPLGMQRKFIVENVDPNLLVKDVSEGGLSAQKLYLEQMYLTSYSPVIERRIRRIRFQDNWQYFYTEKSEDKTIITGKDYAIDKRTYQAYEQDIVWGSKIIKKDRYYFSFHNQYCNYDEFGPLCPNMLEIQVTDMQKEVILPKQFKVIREVTGDVRYSNADIALPKGRFHG